MLIRTGERVLAGSEATAGPSAATERGVHRAVVRVAGGEADLVEVLDDDLVRTAEARLRVRDVELGALRLHDDAGACEVGAGHVREQVVLDLVVEPAEHHRGPPAAPDVAGGTDLLGEEVEALV